MLLLTTVTSSGCAGMFPHAGCGWRWELTTFGTDKQGGELWVNPNKLQPLIIPQVSNSQPKQDSSAGHRAAAQEHTGRSREGLSGYAKQGAELKKRLSFCPGSSSWQTTNLTLEKLAAF